MTSIISYWRVIQSTLSRKKISSFLDSVRWVMRYAWRTNRTLLVAYWANAIVGSLLPAVAALAIRGLINAVTVALASGRTDLQTILFWLVLGFISGAGLSLTNSTKHYIAQQFLEDINYQVSDDIMVHIERLAFSNFEDPTFLDILTRARLNAAGHIAGFLGSTIEISTNMLQMASLLLILVAIEPSVAFLMLMLGVPYLLFQMSLSRRRFVEAHSRASRRRWINYYMRQMSTPTTMPEIRSLGISSLLLERCRTVLADFRDNTKRFQTYHYVGSALFVVLSTAAVYLAFTRAVFQVIQGALTLGDIAIFGAAAMRLRSAAEGIVNGLGRMRLQILHVENLRTFFEIEPASRPLVPADAVEGCGELRFESVRFAYPGTTTPILDDLSFEIAGGETVAIVGENGAGKTTMAKLLAGLYQPDGGQIVIDNQDISQLSVEALRRKVAFVFQFFSRFEATAAENIAYGDWERLLDNPEEVQRIAATVGLDELISQMPQGYETMLGRSFGSYTLSGGQWQFFAIARALARQASILVLDEPTANLDVRAETEIFAHFKRMAEGRTTILISHRFSTVNMADRILVVEKGKIVESGTHSELMLNGGLYSTLYGLHSEQMAPSLNT